MVRLLERLLCSLQDVRVRWEGRRTWRSAGGLEAGTPAPPIGWRLDPCRALCSQRGRALPELAAGAAVRAMEVLPAGGTQDPLLAEAAAGHSAAEGDEEPQPHGRTSRTASLVSGLLIELYSCTEEDEVAAGGDRASRGRPPRSDSLDSSTETSGSDVFLGGRGVGDSRVLQELRERPSLRLQMQYLRQKGERRRWDSCPSVPLAHLRHLLSFLPKLPVYFALLAPPANLPSCATCPPAPFAPLPTCAICAPCPPAPVTHLERWCPVAHLESVTPGDLQSHFHCIYFLPLCRCGSERGPVSPPPSRPSGAQGPRQSRL